MDLRLNRKRRFRPFAFILLGLMFGIARVSAAVRVEFYSHPSGMTPQLIC